FQHLVAVRDRGSSDAVVHTQLPVTDRLPICHGLTFEGPRPLRFRKDAHEKSTLNCTGARLGNGRFGMQANSNRPRGLDAFKGGER
ncbi:MAG: hypothetical protein N3A60_10715, partial [Thermanaerothrix sp.]|nr:hypothetical protein [Thermanaerothrix sp.]